MPMFLKLRFVCDIGSQCRSMGSSFKWEELSISVVPTVEGFFGAMKTLPDGWKRDDHGRIACIMCASGPLRL